MNFLTGARYVFTKDYDLEGFMEYASALGLDFVQLSYEAPLTWVGAIDKARRKRIRDLSLNLGLPVCVHSVTNAVNVAWTNTGIRQESLRQLAEAIEFTYDVGADLITVHPGWKDMYGYRYPEDAYNLAVEGHRQVADSAAGYGIRIAIENMPPGWTSFCTGPEDTKAMLEAIDRPNAGLTLDMGHANILSGSAISDFITAINHKIFLIHIHDNEGKRDQHQAIGEGTIDFHQAIGLLKKAGLNVPLCIESKSLDDLKEGKARLDELLADIG